MFARRVTFFFFGSQCSLIKKKKNLEIHFADVRFSNETFVSNEYTTYGINVPFVTMIMIIRKIETGPGCLVERARVRP